MVEQETRAPTKAPRMRLSQEQREWFLEVLGETGNRRVAAEAIGVEPRLMDQRRRFDRLFDRQWREALEPAARRGGGAARHGARNVRAHPPAFILCRASSRRFPRALGECDLW